MKITAVLIHGLRYELNRTLGITLPAHQIMDNGLHCIEEYPDLKTNVHVHVGDQPIYRSPY